MIDHSYHSIPENDGAQSADHEDTALLEQIPDSPPPSFESYSPPSSPRRRTQDPQIEGGIDRTLEDSFDVNGDSDDNSEDDRRQISLLATSNHGSLSQPVRQISSHETRRTVFQAPFAMSNPNTLRASSAFANDGVFANLSAKPEAGEKTEEQPPSYEQAAADATPPYWETTIFTPGILSDEVYIDGLPVGSFFSFAWNGIISMAFSLVGFLLTYLLHTTHAARHGSRAGLGVTLINYGFKWRTGPPNSSGQPPVYDTPPNPNDHDFDPQVPDTSNPDLVSSPRQAVTVGLSGSEWLTYVLMITGWIILIKAVADFIRARKHEQLILQSPDRGMQVGGNERIESAV